MWCVQLNVILNPQQRGDLGPLGGFCAMVKKKNTKHLRKCVSHMMAEMWFGVASACDTGLTQFLINRASWFSDDDGDDVHHFCEYCSITDDLFQSKINSELANNGVHIYQFPIDDDSVAEVNTSMNAHVPFAVVGSTDFVRVGNKMMRSRQYPWGTVQGTMYLNFGVDIFHLKHCSTRELSCCNLEIIPNCGPYLFRIYLLFFPFPVLPVWMFRTPKTSTSH